LLFYCEDEEIMNEKKGKKRRRKKNEIGISEEILGEQRKSINGR
jgi:hypothetical protein